MVAIGSRASTASGGIPVWKEGKVSTAAAIAKADAERVSGLLEGWPVMMPAGLSDEALAEQLRARGWTCIRDNEAWMSMGEVSRKLGIAPSSFSRLVVRHDYQVPGLQVLRCPNSKKGWSRVLAVKPSAEFWQLMRVVSLARKEGE